MIRAIFMRQLRHHATLLAAIVLGLIVFQVFMVWITSSMKIGPDFQALLQMILPPAMLRFVMNQFGFASFESAVAFGFEHPLVLVSGIAFTVVVATIPAGERETGLLDLILARPVRRERYLAAHVLLVVVGAVLVPLALLLGAVTGLAVTRHLNDVAWHSYIAPAAAYTPLLLMIGAYTLFFAAGAQRRGTAVARAIGLTIVFFWYEVLSTMWEKLQAYEWLTIFYYYAPVNVLAGDRGAREALVLLALSTAFFAGAFLRLRRQQL